MEGTTQPTYKRGLDFWMVYVSNLVVDMLSVLDVVSTRPINPFVHLSNAYTADGRLNCPPNNRGPLEWDGLHLGWERLHCRFHRHHSFRW